MNITPTSYADVFSYPLFATLGGVARLFNLDGKNWSCLVCIHLDCLPSENEITNKNKNTNTKDLNKQISFFPSFNFMAGYLRIVKFSGLVCQTKRKEYVPCVPPVFLSVKPQIISRWVVLLAALLLWVFSAEGSQIKQIVPLADCVKSAPILPYKRLARVLQILRPENALVETARSAGQTLNSALNNFLSLISLGLNTVIIAKMIQSGSALSFRSPSFPFLTYK